MLIGETGSTPEHPAQHPVTGVRGRIPTNLSGGLKSRGHPVGGTGLFQISEVFLQLTERFPNPRVQVAGARIGVAHSIGGPGNNVYVTVLEKTESNRKREEVPRPRMQFTSGDRPRERRDEKSFQGGNAVVEASTTIHVTTSAHRAPIHVALLRIDGRRVFAKLDHAYHEGEGMEAVLAGRKVKLLVKDDGDHYFQVPRGRSFDLGRLVQAIRRRTGGAADTSEDKVSDQRE